MPTRKEASKIKAEWIDKRNNAIDGKIANLQQQVFEDIIPDVIAIAKQEEIRKKVKAGSLAPITSLENKLRKNFQAGFPEIMRETTRSARALGDLNLVYFSTMLDTNRLDEIRDKTLKTVNRKLGVDADGKLIPGGFVDKSIKDTSIQLKFVKEVKKLLSSNADTQTLIQGIKRFFVGTEDQNGVIAKHYNTFSGNLLNTIDRNNSITFADELDLRFFYYFGGLIKSSRSFCIKKNGKIFSREQAEKWKDDPFIVKVYGSDIDQYKPLENMGGPNCLHTPDFITDDLAKGNMREQNSIASQRNKNFVARHGL